MEGKSFNNSFNEEFCQHLEITLCLALETSGHPVLKDFWCDGVSHAPFYNDTVNNEYLDYKNIKKTRSLETTVWMGENGQDRFDATIIFGEQALKRYAKGADLKNTIKEEILIDCDSLDLENKKVKIRLS